MGASPCGNITLQATIDALGNISNPDPVEIPAGFDVSGAQIVLDGVANFGALDVALQGHSAGPDDAPAPAFQAVIDGGAVGLAANGTTPLGGADQVIEIGHLRTLRLLVTVNAGVPTDGSVTVYISSIGTAGRGA